MKTQEIAYDPYSYEIHEDPYPTYERLREEAPLYHNEQGGFWALSRHADVMDAFRDADTFSSAEGVSLDRAASGPHAHRTMSFLAMDEPMHGRMRGLVSKAFTPRRVAALEPRIREIARAHLAEALAAEPAPATTAGSAPGVTVAFDFIDAFAGRLPMDVIGELLGLPTTDRVELRRLSDLLVHREEGMADVPPEGVAAAMDLVVRYSELVADRRANPGDDLVSGLISAEIEGDRLTEDEIIGFLFLMVVAGNETTTKLLGNALWWASQNPVQRDLVFGSPLADRSASDGVGDATGDLEMVPNWVEETLRYDTSTQMLARVTTRDTELHGGIIPKGDRVLLLVGSANRDPRVFDRPDHYDLRRPEPLPQLASFGFGRHFCLGASLARLEARVALEEFVSAIVEFEIDTEGVERVHSVNVRGFAHMPMTVTLREGAGSRPTSDGSTVGGADGSAVGERR